MITFGVLLDEYRDLTKDDTAENTARGIRKINMLQKQLTASEEYWWLEKNYSITTVAGSGVYYLPKDFRKMKSVDQTFGGVNGRIVPVTEYADPSGFDTLFYLTNLQTGTVPQYYHIRGNQLMMFPKSSSNTETITLLYIQRALDMSMIDYNVGFVSSLTTNTTTVTGTGTAWDVPVNVKAGCSLIIDDIAYKIASITNATTLELEQPYQGATISTNTSYVIGEVPLIPEDFCELLPVAAARDYFLKKEDSGAYTLYKDRYAELEGRLKTSTRNKSTENVIQQRKQYHTNPNMFPTVTP